MTKGLGLQTSHMEAAHPKVFLTHLSEIAWVGLSGTKVLPHREHFKAGMGTCPVPFAVRQSSTTEWVKL